MTLKDAMEGAAQHQLQEIRRVLAGDHSYPMSALAAEVSVLVKGHALALKRRDAAEGTLDIILRENDGESDDTLAADYGGLGWEKHPACVSTRELRRRYVEALRQLKTQQKPLSPEAEAFLARFEGL